MAELKIYGIRGSIATPKKDFMEYGGNTSSYTLRTDENTLLFLDAGTGIMYACDELDKKAEQIILAISHTHADHIMGLGMSRLPWNNFNPVYENKKTKLIGPEGILEGLQQYYDGSKNWPVRATNEDCEDKEWNGPNMPGIDFNGLEELIDGSEMRIDESTKLKTMLGNHPVDGNVVLYRFDLNNKSIVYATDNEFDFLDGGIPNTKSEELKSSYIDFISDSDILIADAQYTEEEYVNKNPMNVQGFGHSYEEQIIQLANKANVKKVLITHIGPKNTDKIASEREIKLKEYVKSEGYALEVEFAKEGMSVIL